MNSELQEATPMVFASIFHEELIKALSTRCGAQWRGTASPVASQEPNQDDAFEATIALAGNLHGDLHLTLTQSHALALTSVLLSETSEVLGEAETNALIQLLDSGVAGLCEAAAETYGVFTATTAISSPAQTEFPNTVALSLTDADGVEVLLHASVSSELAESLSAAIASHEPTLMQDLANTSSDVSSEPTEPLNLDLVLDVELNVTLRFGQRKLTLREVLELTSGSVIELDRQVEEPVELLLDGKVIARGEAVVIDGNYGLRVTEVPQQLAPTILR